MTRAQRKALKAIELAADALCNSRDPKAKMAAALVAGVVVEFRKDALDADAWRELVLCLGRRAR